MTRFFERTSVHPLIKLALFVVPFAAATTAGATTTDPADPLHGGQPSSHWHGDKPKKNSSGSWDANAVLHDASGNERDHCDAGTYETRKEAKKQGQKKADELNEGGEC